MPLRFGGGHSGWERWPEPRLLAFCTSQAGPGFAVGNIWGPSSPQVQLPQDSACDHNKRFVWALVEAPPLQLLTWMPTGTDSFTPGSTAIYMFPAPGLFIPWGFASLLVLRAFPCLAPNTVSSHSTE